MFFITGGTGAIGGPLVEALTGDSSPVLLLTREPFVATRPGVKVIKGNVLEREVLGMTSHDAAFVRANATTILHAAAMTRFDAPLDVARSVNVDGTRHVLDFAASCPRLQRLCALSTIYVAGRRTGLICESDLDHACGFVNAYEQSKFEAEQLLREWMPRLPIIVCRLSTVLGDSAQGTVGRLAAIHHAIRFLYHSLLPMIPGSPGSPVDLIATDYAVAAVRHLSGAGFVAGSTFHICAGAETVSEDELIDLVIDAFLRYRPAWRRRRIDKPAIVELETFELFRQSVEAVADQGLRAPVAVLGHFAPQLAFPKRFSDEACRSALEAIGVIRPSIRQTVTKVVEYLIAHNWSGVTDRVGEGLPGE
jgi:nucleoside-diphosphate-sugar epimerase